MIKEIAIEKVFLFISLVFGLIYVLILPPFQSVDEASHFYRGYSIIQNEPIAQNLHGKIGAYLPSSLQKLASGYDFLIKNTDARINPKYIFDSASIKLNSDNVEFINFQNTALYSPISYLTQIPGMYIAKRFNANPLLIFYLGRISNLLGFTLLVYFAIKIIPFYKLTTMLLALMPMSLSLAGSLTSDVMVMGLNFLWIAILLKFVFEKTKISNLQILGLIILATFLGLCKHYFMLIPLIFLLPKSNFKNTLKYTICTLGVLFSTAVALLLWQNVINTMNFDMNSAANATKQLAFIAHNPLSYLLVLLKTLIIKTPRIFITMIGVLGWQDTRLDFLTYILYPILVAFSLFIDKNNFKFEKWQIYLLSFDVIFSVGLIFTNMYLMWSAVASPVIYGLNGKYFTPIMLPFLLLFFGQRKINLPEQTKLFIFIAIILILISSDLSIIHRFYGLTPNLYYKI